MSGIRAPITDGGQAFPSTVKNWNDHTAQDHGGMSLRDWFAGQFLTGAVSSPDNCGPLDVSAEADQFDIDAAMRAHWGAVTRCAFIAADAMLAERAKLADATP